MELRLNTLLARLLIGFAIPLILFSAVAVVSYIVIDRLLEALERENHTHEVITIAQRMQQRLDLMRMDVERFPLRDADRLPRTYQESRTQFQELNRTLGGLVGDNPDQQERLRQMIQDEEAWNGVVERRLKTLKPLPEQSRDELRELAHRFFDDAQASMGRLQKNIEDFIKEEEGLLAKRRQTTANQSRQSAIVIGVTTTAAFFLTILLSLLAARGVTRPIEKLRNAAAQLLAGEFHMVQPDGPTEIAQLIVHFNHVAMTLSQRAALLQESEQRYRAYVGAVSHILWTTDAKGEVTADIPTWRAFTGQSVEELRGLGWLDAVHPEDREEVRNAWIRTVQGQQVYEREYRLRSSQGVYRHFACRGVPIVGTDGVVREWIGTCTDVTERVEEQALREAKESAEARSQAKSEFLAKMSHELRTPLNAVIGMSKMLSTQRFGPLTAKQADYLHDITSAGEHLLALINDILDLAKVEAGRMDVQPESFSVGETVAALLSTLRPLALGKRITVDFVPPKPDGAVTTDPARFRQILYNLLSNAIKFTPELGRVTVTCAWVDRPDPGAEVVVLEEGDAGALRVTVRDTGIGIPADKQEVIWDEFRQLKPSTGEELQGTGLGLALTRRLVKLLGGVIWLESEPGKGSTFTFILPRRLTTPPAPPPGKPEDNARPLALIIEDYPPTSKMLADWLAEAGLATACAGDGEAGLAMVRALRPRLILLDIHLPKLDGWQVLTRLKSDPETAGIPVVIVTITEDRLPAASLHVQEYFVKPIDREDFMRRLQERQPELFERAHPLRILVVDDDPSSRVILSRLLRIEGTVVREASGGQEALEMIEAERPDVVVLDLLMPAMDGFTVVAELRRRPELAELPILILTGKELTGDERDWLNGRIQALLSKERLSAEKLRSQLASMGLLQEAAAN
jgi:PAS domain S-box-containing protein